MTRCPTPQHLNMTHPHPPHPKSRRRKSREWRSSSLARQYVSPARVEGSQARAEVQFALSAGLTVMIIPSIRRAQREMQVRVVSNFMSNRHLHRSSALPGRSSEEAEAEQEEPLRPEDQFNGALLGLKALGIATGLVAVSAGLGTLAISRYLDVRTVSRSQDDGSFAQAQVPEFGARMRAIIHSTMPDLVETIHRSPDTVEEAEAKVAFDAWVKKHEGLDNPEDT